MTIVTRPCMSSDHTGQKQCRSNVYSQLSGLEDVTGFQWFHQGWFYSRRWSSSRISSTFLPEPGVSLKTEDQTLEDSEDSERVEWVWCSWKIGWVQVWPWNVCRECVCGCWHKNTEGTIYNLLHTSSLLGVRWVWSLNIWRFESRSWDQKPAWQRCVSFTRHWGGWGSRAWEQKPAWDVSHSPVIEVGEERYEYYQFSCSFNHWVQRGQVRRRWFFRPEVDLRRLHGRIHAGTLGV